ncbi:hypothetical protein [Staphylococcus xylosus]|uniref:hypothetical protein n=1 Tax=Staphylococcus xylosus TaxID=1288 RepID=UPI000347006D|nr:hypothetical protein [Staphylococcus xylosus]
MSLNVNINSYLKLLENESLTEQRYYQEKNYISKFFYKLFKHPRDKRKELLYLDSIDDESFYQLFSAYIIGSELLTIPDCLNEDIMIYGNIDDFFKDRVKIMKDRLPLKHEAAIHFKDKDCNFVKESLLAFQEKFCHQDIF